MFGRRHIIDFIALPVGLIALGLLIWWAIYAGPDRADKIEADLKAEVTRMLSEDDFGWVSAEVEGRNITLTGTAPSKELHQLVLARLKRASGTGGLFWGSIKKLNDETDLQPPLDVYEFKASYRGKLLRLEGSLPGVFGKDRLMTFLKSKGLEDDKIEDEIVYRDGVPDGDWYGMAELGLSQLISLAIGEMDLIEKRLLLTGQTRNETSRLAIVDELTRPPTGYTVDVDLSGSVIWSASLANNRLVLHGDVPDATDKSQITELAKRFFDGEVVNNQGVGQLSERAWLAGVRTALPNFLNFISGEMTYRGNELVISGEATQTAIDYLREDVTRIGTLVNFQFDVTPTLKPLKTFAGLKEGETPDFALCEAALQEALSGHQIEFRNRQTSMTRETGFSLDGVETVLRVCQNTQIEISAYTHVNRRYVSGQQLTEGRQRAVSDYFIARGVPLNQVSLTEVIAGASAPNIGEGALGASQIRMRLKE